MTTSQRIFDAEAAIDGLTRDVENFRDLTADYQVRVYMLREKIERIIAGDDRFPYESAFQRWQRDTGR